MANYNGLISTLQHRLPSSFSLLANYTWSKCLNTSDAQGDTAGNSFQNPNNPAGDYGPCGSDFRHVENIVLITQSKFPLTGIKAWLVNNWVFAPLIHIQSGAPLHCQIRAGQLLHRSCFGPSQPDSWCSRLPSNNPSVERPARRIAAI